MFQLGSAYGKIVIDGSGAMAGVAQAQGAMAGLRSSLSGIGKSLTMGVSLPLIGVGAAAVKTAKDFEAQMAILEIAARSSGTALDDLEKAALAVGADTDLVGISASEAADAMTNFYKAGLDTNAIFGDMEGYLAGTSDLSGALRAAIDLAAASDLDLAAASDTVAVAMATFGLEANQATAIADSFVRAADASVTEVGELADALVNVGPTAAAFGWNLEDTNTALAILSERGIRGSEAGTALKSMMTNIMRPTDKVTETLRDLGVSLYDADGQMRDLPQIIADLENSLSGLSEEQRNTAIQTLAGTYGMKALNTLLAEGSDGWEDMEKAIGEAATAQDVALARTDTLAGSWEQFMGTLETLAIQIGKPLIDDFIRPAVEWLTDMFNVVSGKLDPKMAGLAGTIGLVAVAIGPLLSVLGAILSPVGLVIAAVVGLAAAWKNNWGGIRDALTEVWDNKIKPALAELWAWLQEQIPPAIAALSAFWTDTLKPALETVWAFVIDSLIPALGDIVAWLITHIPPAIEALAAFWTDTLKPALETVWQFISENVVPIFETIVEWLSTNIPVAIEAARRVWEEVLKPALEIVWQFAEEHLLPLFEALKELFNVGLTLALTALAGLWENVLKPALEVVWEFIKLHLQPIWEGLMDKFDNAKTEILDPLKKAFDAIGTAIDTVVGWIETLTGKLTGIELPDWLKPGSPPPLYWALQDVRNAMRDLATTELPKLQAGLNFGGMTPAIPAPALAGAGGSGYGNYRNYETNVTVPIERVGDEVDIEVLAYRVADVISRRNR